jgi:3-dehydroquinate synthase
MKVKRIQVKSAAGKYSVLCGTGILRNAAREIAKLGKFSSVHAVSSPKVWRATKKIVTCVVPHNVGRNLHLFNDAEPKKNMRTAESLCRSLTRAGADRKSLIVAVGGGVVGDVAGYVAASYLRGVALVHIPTTLVAQVDSSIGGKTGVNLPEGKNLVGAFYPPRLVLVDFDLLRTLPDREFRSGLAEVIKYGIIADQDLFEYLERNMEKVLRRDRAALDYLIPRCVQIKAEVVSCDERESGLREILNFGHTFGHALESVTRYRRFKHGEAVALGLMAAALLGHEVGFTAADDVSRIVSLVRRLGTFPTGPRVTPKTMIAAMRSDKKSKAGKLRFVLSPRIGQARSSDTVPMSVVESVLNFFLRSARQTLAASGKLHG